MHLYHFSEDPDIVRFEPRAPLARPEVEPLVWAIDEWHAPMYYVPRECPCLLLARRRDGSGRPRALVRRHRRTDGHRG